MVNVGGWHKLNGKSRYRLWKIEIQVIVVCNGHRDFYTFRLLYLDITEFGSLLSVIDDIIKQSVIKARSRNVDTIHIVNIFF